MVVMIGLCITGDGMRIRLRNSRERQAAGVHRIGRGGRLIARISLLWMLMVEYLWLLVMLLGDRDRCHRDCCIHGDVGHQTV